MEVIHFSNLAELEESAAVRGGPRGLVQLKFVCGRCAFAEAAEIYRLVEERRLEVDEASRKILRAAAHHFDLLDCLETSIELLNDNLTCKAPMNRLCFDIIRSAANAVVSSAHTSHSLAILKEIVVDAQRVGRVCRGLMFGAADVPAAELQPDDLDWLLAGFNGGKLLSDLDGAELQGVHAGGEALVLAGGNGDLDGVQPLAYGDRGEPLPDDNPFALLAALGDDVGEATPGAGGPLPLAGIDVLEDGLLAALFDGDEALVDGVGEAPAGLIEVKEDTVVALLQLKVGYLLEAIARAKERVILP